MYALLVLVLLAAGVGVLTRALGELHPSFHAPKAMTTVFAAAVAMGVCWALNYSVFAAFGQAVREPWMNPVGSGVLLVAAAELTDRAFALAKAAVKR